MYGMVLSWDPLKKNQNGGKGNCKEVRIALCSLRHFLVRSVFCTSRITFWQHALKPVFSNVIEMYLTSSKVWD